jgi:hypothetical protein
MPIDHEKVSMALLSLFRDAKTIAVLARGFGDENSPSTGFDGHISACYEGGSNVRKLHYSEILQAKLTASCILSSEVPRSLGQHLEWKAQGERESPYERK